MRGEDLPGFAVRVCGGECGACEEGGGRGCLCAGLQSLFFDEYTHLGKPGCYNIHYLQWFE